MNVNHFHVSSFVNCAWNITRVCQKSTPLLSWFSSSMVVVDNCCQLERLFHTRGTIHRRGRSVFPNLYCKLLCFCISTALVHSLIQYNHACNVLRLCWPYGLINNNNRDYFSCMDIIGSGFIGVIWKTQLPFKMKCSHDSFLLPTSTLT